MIPLCKTSSRKMPALRIYAFPKIYQFFEIFFHLFNVRITSLHRLPEISFRGPAIISVSCQKLYSRFSAFIPKKQIPPPPTDSVKLILSLLIDFEKTFSAKNKKLFSFVFLRESMCVQFLCKYYNIINRHECNMSQAQNNAVLSGL